MVPVLTIGVHSKMIYSKLVSRVFCCCQYGVVSVKSPDCAKHSFEFAAPVRLLLINNHHHWLTNRLLAERVSALLPKCCHWKRTYNHYALSYFTLVNDRLTCLLPLFPFDNFFLEHRNAYVRLCDGQNGVVKNTFTQACTSTLLKPTSVLVLFVLHVYLVAKLMIVLSD